MTQHTDCKNNERLDEQVSGLPALITGILLGVVSASFFWWVVL